MQTQTYLVALCAVVLCSAPGTSSAQSGADIDVMKQRLAEVQHQRQVETANLENFDDLDFNVYNGQNGTNLARATPRTSSSTTRMAARPRAWTRTSLQSNRRSSLRPITRSSTTRSASPQATGQRSWAR